jgi:ComF family protein
MIGFIKEYSLPINDMDLILPVPLHTQRLREREFNQAGLLSRNIAAHFKKESCDNILRRSRPTKTQTDLETNQRFLNVKGSFSVNDKADLKGKNILLVDDVLTTGATSSEAALTLKNAGANIVFVLTLAN